MRRDYKHTVNRRKRRTLSPWIGVAAGLLIGLFVAFLVYIKLQAVTHEPEYRHETLPPPAATAPQEELREVTPDEPDATPPPPPKPRFDFYTLLPEIEVVVPEEEIEQSRKPAPPPVAAPVTADTKPAESEPAPVTASEPAPDKPAAEPAPVATGTYYLQVGSFSDAGKADAFKAELALLGLQTSIQRVTINSKDTYHRVRVGPFATLDELDRTRSRLKAKGIESTPIKVRG